MPRLASPHYQLTSQPPAFLFFASTRTSRSAQMAPLPRSVYLPQVQVNLRPITYPHLFIPEAYSIATQRACGS
jgi:hypothetical protein